MVVSLPPSAMAAGDRDTRVSDARKAAKNRPMRTNLGDGDLQPLAPFTTAAKNPPVLLLLLFGLAPEFGAAPAPLLGPPVSEKLATWVRR